MGHHRGDHWRRPRRPLRDLRRGDRVQHDRRLDRQRVLTPIVRSAQASERDTARRWVAPAALAALAAAGAAAVLLRDPHQSHAWGACPVNALTGGYCPGCGSMRGLHDLLVGHPLEAIGHNLLLLPALFWLGWWWVHELAAANGRGIAGPPSSARFCWSLLAVLAAFTILRNLPGSPLAP
ncbi:MAG: DUF2752 domain-containing protein [Aeromicrobium sp.]